MFIVLFINKTNIYENVNIFSLFPRGDPTPVGTRGLSRECVPRIPMRVVRGD